MITRLRAEDIGGITQMTEVFCIPRLRLEVLAIIN